ncbi:unnamed protein product, partial [Mesorhabditis belari]|uniref:TrmE-type G domain-containing protein n=1 Tax=Mesorhabditis belari TaxID=2138241 RepID=A0AAF3F2J3_9BILA
MSTIFALSSGALPSAIAIVRLSGPKSGEVLRVMSRRRNGVLDPRKMFYTRLHDHDETLIDTAMAVYLPGPSTFTGEDTAELFVHGSRAVVNTLARSLSQFDGVRHAKRGEFSKRAFYNGKMDLAAARGLRDLIHAETDRQRRVAQKQMDAGPAVRQLREDLVEAVGRATLLIDFGEHVDCTLDEVKVQSLAILEKLRKMVSSSRSAEIVHRGLRIVLVGRPNTGKSSLMNRLVQRDVAIVSETAGTTRDSIEVRLVLNGIPTTLTDTAGLRETDCTVEREGVARAKKRIEEADIALAIFDARRPEELAEIIAEIESVDKTLCIVPVANKCDLLEGKTPSSSAQTVQNVPVPTSAITTDGIDALRAKLERVVEDLCPDESSPSLTEFELLSEALTEVEQSMETVDAALCAHHLQNALNIVGELSGATVTEAILDRLFAQFCIGK